MIGVGVIGCGYWGPNLIRNFATASGARLLAVCDLKQEPLDRVRARWPAIVTTRDESSVELPALQEFCRTKLAGYKVPRQLHVTDEIPRTPVGKPDYRWAKRLATGS